MHWKKPPKVLTPAPALTDDPPPPVEMAPVDPPGERLLTRAEVADKLRITPHAVYKLDRKGVLPKPVTIGTRWVRYRLSDIDAWIEAGCPQ